MNKDTQSKIKRRKKRIIYLFHENEMAKNSKLKSTGI